MISRIAKNFQDYFSAGGYTEIRRQGIYRWVAACHETSSLPGIWRPTATSFIGTYQSRELMLKSSSDNFINIPLRGVIVGWCLYFVYAAIFHPLGHPGGMLVGILILSVVTNMHRQKIKIIQNIVGRNNRTRRIPQNHCAILSFVKEPRTYTTGVGRLNKNTYKILGLELKSKEDTQHQFHTGNHG